MYKQILEIDPNQEDDWFVEEKLEQFNEVFAKVFPKGEVGMIAKNHGWQKLDGYRSVEYFNEGVSALSKATLNGKAHAKVYVGKNETYGYHIALNTAHHDSPCWDEWTYMVRPNRFMKVVA